MRSFHFDVVGLITNFEIAGQSTCVQLTLKHRSLDAAAWLASMTAIPESAPIRKSFDIFESRIETCIDGPDLKLPHSWRIHDQAAGGEKKKLSGRRRM